MPNINHLVVKNSFVPLLIRFEYPALKSWARHWGDLKGDLGRLGLSLPFSPVAADLRGICKGVMGTK
jgi:hypothetical protein